MSDWICPACGRCDADPVGPGAVCPHDGSVLLPTARVAQAASDPVLGRVVGGQYAVYDLLGRGGMGAVYRAVHLRLRRHVAIKTILPDRIDEDDGELRARFEQEARMLSEMRHPGIVSVYDFGEEGRVLYMVLELIEGVSLSDVLRRESRLPLDRSLDIARQLAEALQVPHQRGLIHRDIKPSNIMLEPRPAGGGERVVLIDFGVAKAHGGVTPEYGPTPRTQTGVAVGTPRYMAPEQLSGNTLGPWTDHYALAVVTWRMLAGSSPFTGAPAEMIAAHLRDPVPPLPPELNLGALDPVFQQAMAKAPAERFPDGVSFVGALEVGQELLPGVASLDPALGLHPTAVMASPLEGARRRRESREPSDLTPYRGVIEAPTVGTPVVSEPSRVRWLVAAMLFGGLAAVMALVLLDQVGPQPSVDTQPQPGLAAATGGPTTEAAPAKGAEPGRPAMDEPAGTAPSAAVGAAPAPPGGAALAAETPDDEDSAGEKAPGEKAPGEKAPGEKASGEEAVAAKPAAKPPEAKPIAKSASDRKPTGASRKPARTKPTRRAKPISIDDQIKRVKRHVDRCECDRARRALGKLRGQDAAVAGKLDESYTLACGIVGMGCLTEGGAGGP